MPAGDASGFIDALTALAAHLRERELVESNAKRSWGLLMVASLVLLAVQGIADVVLLQGVPQHYEPWGTLSPWPLVWLTASAGGTAALAAILFGRLATSSIRLAQDSAERVALRHEDSPLRDRIRIAQWVLFDTAFTRFCLAERGLSARVALGVLGVAGAGTLAVWLLLAGVGVANGRGGFQADIAAVIGLAQSAVLIVFLVCALVAILLTRRAGLKELADAQHLARQVLAFDRDFGGFLPTVERNRVQKIVSAGNGGARDDTEG